MPSECSQLFDAVRWREMYLFRCGGIAERPRLLSHTLAYTHTHTRARLTWRLKTQRLAHTLNIRSDFTCLCKRKFAVTSVWFGLDVLSLCYIETHTNTHKWNLTQMACQTLGTWKCYPQTHTHTQSDTNSNSKVTYKHSLATALQHTNTWRKH